DTWLSEGSVNWSPRTIRTVKHARRKGKGRTGLKEDFIMSDFSREGIYNPAYHDTETLEFHRSPTRRSHHYNPYDSYQEPSERVALDLMPPEMLPPYEDDHEMTRGQGSWRATNGMAMRPLFPQNGNDGWRYDQGGGSALGKLGLTEEDIIEEIENGESSEGRNWSKEENLVKELVAMSTRERIQAIRSLPVCFEDKKNIRLGIIPLLFIDWISLRRCGAAMETVRQTMQLWQSIMKEIGGRFGTSVLSYFSFLKWLLMFNIFSFLVNFGFITIPQLVQGSNITNCQGFKGLELITGAGHFRQTVMYYGAYSGSEVNSRYNMQLAYFFTIAAYLVLCAVSLIYSMASSFRRNFVLSDAASVSAWRLLCSWDFNVVNEKAVRQRRSNLRIQLKESLSENTQRKLLSMSERMKKLGGHLCAWVLSIGLAASSCVAIYYLCQYSLGILKSSNLDSLVDEASALLLPFVVSLLNLVIPLLCSLLTQMEHYSNPRTQIYVIILRNVLLKMSILGILCYHWMNNVAQSNLTCWENLVGQELYRLVIVDFFFLMIGSFFGEFLRRFVSTTFNRVSATCAQSFCLSAKFCFFSICCLRVIGTKLIPKLGVPEFDVARNVLDLIFAQTLAWIGIYFSPLLPIMQMIKFFLLFYISLSQNCQPPRRSGRAAQMQTFFIALLFIPSFVGALSMVAYTVWCLKPSDICGPFQGLNTTYEAVSIWMESVDRLQFNWVIWIYDKMITSELFFFLLSLIILVLIYFFWQITQGRKLLITLLKEQIILTNLSQNFDGRVKREPDYPT
ncbi:transmembrane channel-like protein 5-like, partial [Scleropages formosus]